MHDGLTFEQYVKISTLYKSTTLNKNQNNNRIEEFYIMFIIYRMFMCKMFRKERIYVNFSQSTGCTISSNYILPTLKVLCLEPQNATCFELHSILNYMLNRV